MAQGHAAYRIAGFPPISIKAVIVWNIDEHETRSLDLEMPKHYNKSTWNMQKKYKTIGIKSIFKKKAFPTFWSLDY